MVDAAPCRLHLPLAGADGAASACQEGRANLICPQCRGEFRQGIGECPDCRVPLLSEDDAMVRTAELERERSVVVLRTADPSALALAQALLREADISFAVNNERMIGLFPSALSGPELDSRFRAAEIEVLESTRERALETLSDIEGVVTASRGDLSNRKVEHCSWAGATRRASDHWEPTAARRF